MKTNITNHKTITVAQKNTLVRVAHGQQVTFAKLIIGETDYASSRSVPLC
jgi:hypothetical protein